MEFTGPLEAATLSTAQWRLHTPQQTRFASSASAAGQQVAGTWSGNAGDLGAGTIEYLGGDPAFNDAAGRPIAPFVVPTLYSF